MTTNIFQEREMWYTSACTGNSKSSAYSLQQLTNKCTYKGWLISNAHSEISRKIDHVFKQTKAGSKVQCFS